MMIKKQKKAAAFILYILLVIFLAAAGAAFYFYYQETLKVAALDEELGLARRAKEAAESQLTRSQQELQELNAALSQTRKHLERINSQLDEAESEKGRLNYELEELTVQLTLIKERSDKFSAEVKLAQEEIKRLNNLILTLRQDKKKLEAELVASKDSQLVSLGTILVTDKEDFIPAPEALPERLEGEVLVINRNHNFAVINLGRNHGLSGAEVFSVYHGSNYIGDIKIEEAREHISACNFLSEIVKNRISEGDRVVKK